MLEYDQAIKINKNLKRIENLMKEKLEIYVKIILKSNMENVNMFQNTVNKNCSLKNTSNILEILISERKSQCNLLSEPVELINHPKNNGINQSVDLFSSFLKPIQIHSQNKDDDCTINNFQELFCNL